MTLRTFGFSYQRAAKPHTCWLCGNPIAKGDKYFTASGNMDGKMFAIKHCRDQCECAGDMLDQNPNLAAGVFFKTLADYQATQKGLPQ